MTDPIPADCAAKFRPVKLLGEGGYGRVYLAEQLGLDRHVALKVLRTDVAPDAEQRTRFVEEGRVTAQISHPNVVRVIDAGCADGTPWLVYELVEGPSLRQRASERPMTWNEALLAAMQIALALEEAHKLDIVHRDVKAENVLQVADGIYKLADFGIAKWTDTGVKTRTGFVIGTPTHLAPELIKGLPPSPASDVYALGVLLYELLTGRLPFPDANLGVLMRKHLEEPVQTPTRLQPGLPSKLNGILKHALEKEPGDRTATARELRQELEAVLAEAGDTAGSRPARAPDVRPRSRGTARVPRSTGKDVSLSVIAPSPARSWHSGVLAGVLGTLVVVGAAALALRSKPPPEPPRPTPSPVASPSPAPPFDERFENMKAVARDLKVMTTLREAANLKLRRSPLEPVDPGFWDAQLGRPLAQCFRSELRLLEVQERGGFHGCLWHYVATLADEMLCSITSDRSSLLPRQEESIQRLEAIGRASASSPDPYHRDAGRIILAAARYARGGRGASEFTVLDAYADALATYRLSGLPEDDDAAHVLRNRTMITTLRLNHADRLCTSRGLPWREGVRAVRDGFALMAEAETHVGKPDWDLVADGTLGSFIAYCQKGSTLEKMGELPRAELKQQVELLDRLVGAYAKTASAAELRREIDRLLGDLAKPQR